MVTFLGAKDAESRAAADWARATLERLGALPYLERLDAALAGDNAPSASVGAPSGARVEETAAAG